ncbi:MAG: hypothetical protein DRP11_03670 [Candidatus Aenigmatarchaeota archaeon]|nr:MAG: hypothetical protein DRP11_03670 [Candidatus Aenigmarchaeota archaeon]
MKKDIVPVIARQKEEVKERLNRRIVERDISSKIGGYLEKNIIKVVTGVRRSGKSFLSMLLLRNRNFGYVNFDEKELIDVRLDDLLSGIIEIYGKVGFLLMDEIQNVKGWELWINSLQRRGYNLVVTGSNARLLSKELATHLTGRYVEFENFPFSFVEYLRWRGIEPTNLHSKEKEGELKNALREYMKKGGFPEYLVENLSSDYLRTLFDSIIYSDIVKRWKVRYPTKIEDVARYLLSTFSREYSATKLKNILGLRSTFTVLNYIKYIEEAFLLFSLERFSFKQKEFLKAPKKVYSVDLGLSNLISTRLTEDSGLMMENLVFLDLKRDGLTENKEIFYFKSNEGEVDFVIKEGMKIKKLIQVTHASARDEIERREIKTLLKLGKELKCKDLICITWDYEAEEKNGRNTIRFIPLWKWLLKL